MRHTWFWYIDLLYLDTKVEAFVDHDPGPALLWDTSIFCECHREVTKTKQQTSSNVSNVGSGGEQGMAEVS